MNRGAIVRDLVRRLVSKDRERSDSGVSLILVLVFLIVGSLLVGGLATMASNDLLNSGNFAKARSLYVDATSAVDVAVQSIRYTPLLAPSQTLNASPPTPCWPGGEPTTPLPTTGGNRFDVWCSTVWTPTSANTRTVTLSACLSSVAAATCAYRPLVQEVVSFDDYPPGGAPPTYAECSTYCGESMTVNRWVQHPTMPTVTHLGCAPTPGSCAASPLGGPITGTAHIAVTGTGFVKAKCTTTTSLTRCGTTVEFVEESSGVPATDNVVVTVTPKTVTVASSTSLTVTAPPVSEGSTYFVVVTTPSGSSAYGGPDVFTYSAGTPTVTSVCTGPAGTGPTGATCNTNASGTSAKGAVAGGTSLVIWGTNFLCSSSCRAGGAPSVSFVAVPGGTTLTAVYVTSVSETELTVTTPAEYQVVPPAEFYVTVATPEGTSASSVAFDYVPNVPTVQSVKYTSTKESLTIKGTGFVTGDDTVGFTAVTTCGTRSPWKPVTTSKTGVVTVVSPTQITAGIPTTGTPSLTKGKVYFVVVQSKAATNGASSCYPSFTYK